MKYANNFTHNLSIQFQAIKRTLFLILAVSALLLGIVLVVHFNLGIPLDYFSIDPASALSQDPAPIIKGKRFIGFLSQVGIFFWSASATVSLFSAYLLTQRSNNLQLKKFFLTSGLLSLLLGIDDGFLLHEGFHAVTGLPERVAFIFYFALIFIWLLKFNSIILKTEFILLGIAFILFGFSIMIDIMPLTSSSKELIEDFPKLIGILTWTAYFLRCEAFVICRCISD